MTDDRQPFVCLRSSSVLRQTGVSHAQATSLHCLHGAGGPHVRLRSNQPRPKARLHPRFRSRADDAPDRGPGHLHGDDARFFHRFRRRDQSFRAGEQRQGRLSQIRRRGRGAEQSHPQPGRAAGRRVLWRGQHFPLARARLRHLRAVCLARGGKRVPRIQTRPGQLRAPGGLRRRVRELRQGLFCRQRSSATADARRPDEAGLQEPAGRREPGDLLARSGVHARHRQALRGGQVSRLLEAVARERRESG